MKLKNYETINNLENYQENNKLNNRKIKFNKPQASYITLIQEAIKKSPEEALTLNEIYESLKKMYPEFNTSYEGWKNSIRHNLSLNDCFIKVPKIKGKIGKGHYWKIAPEAKNQFNDTTIRRRPRNFRTQNKLNLSSVESINQQTQNSLSNPLTNQILPSIHNQIHKEKHTINNYNCYLETNNQQIKTNIHKTDYELSINQNSNINLDNSNGYHLNNSQLNFDHQQQNHHLNCVQPNLPQITELYPTHNYQCNISNHKLDQINLLQNHQQNYCSNEYNQLNGIAYSENNLNMNQMNYQDNYTNKIYFNNSSFQNFTIKEEFDSFNNYELNECNQIAY